MPTKIPEQLKEVATHPSDKTKLLKPQPIFADPMDAAFALFTNDDAWYMGHAYLAFEYKC